MLVESSKFEIFNTRPQIFNEVARVTEGKADKKKIRAAVSDATPHSAIWEKLSPRWQGRWQNWTALTVAILILDHNGKLHDRSIGSKVDVEALDTDRRFIPFQEIWNDESVGRIKAFRMKLFEDCQIPHNSSAITIRSIVRHTMQVLAFGVESVREVDNSKRRARGISALENSQGRKKRSGVIAPPISLPFRGPAVRHSE